MAWPGFSSEAAEIHDVTAPQTTEQAASQMKLFVSLSWRNLTMN
jgi:hypothetical protein